ncbi:unnamed protein product [Bursaphelenchus okinawaensis]|uniref:Uncharacterized protein n=1 Tax=Bursaphelenchus okinawaensis TaxID=465554 RepID=A0A811KQH4_9BILA|nr:unnamed protein product [Bursaphelenchus okinawaensis]CAG9108365.1 unnamed protein product [Bursaphelenchus okinawaensis]
MACVLASKIGTIDLREVEDEAKCWDGLVDTLTYVTEQTVNLKELRCYSSILNLTTIKSDVIVYKLVLFLNDELKKEIDCVNLEVHANSASELQDLSLLT